MKALLLLVTLALALPASAAKVAVVDSGTDFGHEVLSTASKMNEKEIAGNRVDDDGNGKVDDVVGWNFIDNYNRVFFPEHLDYYNPIIYPLFTIIAHKQAGIATAEENLFWKNNVESLTPERKEMLRGHLNAFGQYAHGTHVSGIVKWQAPNAKIMSARVFADQLPNDYVTDSLYASQGRKSWTDIAYKILAATSNGLFGQVATYLNEQNIDVANYSLGVPLQMIAKALLGVKGIKNPTEAQLAEETQRAFKKYEPYAMKWMAASPNTLFVVAAGNDGTNNDLFPTFPANVRAKNSITVAATLDYVSLATFSCYGKTTVDIAAPGVAIKSSVPSLDRKMMVPMSGTSMAAPFITGVAARIKELNPALDPVGIKTILMGTVDKKPWLEGKVISGGVVNVERAADAAVKSRTMTIDAAIVKARMAIVDTIPSAKVNAGGAGADHLADQPSAALIRQTVF